ncbi:MAG TPA: Rne/Rng family ribonuclease [Terriglobales bacterium]|jgi:Rne/Rng family ribonuclease|nr:Rne/Rng family ribonuclease [Terriglobales bacterium]
MSKELFVSSTPHETKVAVVEEDQLNEIYFERENEYTLAGSIYKGRVTRVLPGMQSAFVEIGLERDAFLYVTDFFEPQEEEGDESFEAIPAEDSSRGRRRVERPAHERPAAQLEDMAETPSENGEVETFAGGEAKHSATQFIRDENPNPSEAIDEENEAQAAASERQHQAPARETLPGETHGGHERASGDRDSSERRPFGRRRRGRRGRGFPDSKFDSRNAARPRSQDEKPHGPPAGYQPIILPGESISKYRNMAEAQTTQPATAQPIAEPARQEDHTAAEKHTVTAAAGHETAELDTQDYTSRDFRTQNYETAETTIDESENEVSASGSGFSAATAEDKVQAIQPDIDYEETSRRDTEEIDVAAILDKHRREIAAERASEQTARSNQLSPWYETPGVEPHRPESRFGSMPGLVEEEEIEEEEMDQPSLLHAFEDDEYEDFEEEMLDRVETKEQRYSAPGQESREASPSIEAEAASEHVETHISEDEEEEEEDLGADSMVEAEMQAAGGEELIETEENEQTPAGDETEPRAETRGPSGYQQKVGFDRGRRRRRGGGGGGRRPRPHGGGGGGKRFYRAPLPQISDLLKEGQEILVQIAKEPIGKKGARITSHIALPGRFLVYMPTVNHNGVSRKIASEEERHRLKRIILSERQAAEGHHGGFIVRTAAAHASEEDLRADIRFLLNLWNEIRSRADSSKSPALIYHDLNLVERILRDQVSEGFSHIWVDNEQEYERIVRFVSRFQPQLVKRVKLYTKETPLFEQFNIQEEINKALKSKVWLKSGGYIVINQTEALVAIDVNTGKFVGKTQKLEDTIVKTNVDAIKEIVRQVRLRDLGGIIVIDFIDMDERRNRQKVMQALEEALKSDRAPSKVLQFNDFGLVAITRKRVKQSLERTLGQPCTYCTGTGLIKSVATVCNEIYVEMRKMSRHLEGKDVFVRVNPEVGKALKANNARWLQDMEELTGKTVIVKPDPTLHQEQFDIH